MYALRRSLIKDTTSVALEMNLENSGEPAGSLEEEEDDDEEEEEGEEKVDAAFW